MTPLNQKREVNVIEEEFEDAVEEIKQEPEVETRPSTATAQVSPKTPSQRPTLAERRQSIVPPGQQRLIQSLLLSERPQSRSAATDFLSGALPTINAGMVQRKIWVKRPGASATLVTITEDDVVDDVREAILRKYGNSLGRSLDAPDITLRIVSREHTGRVGPIDRILGPEEQICRTLDTYYTGGQTVEEALIIDIPQRRTPRPSPRYGFSLPQYMVEESRMPTEENGYFPPMPVIPSPHNAPSNHSGSVHHQPVHAMSVLTTGQVPPLPSPGGRTYRQHGSGQHRPKFGRNHTSSPTIITSAAPNQHMIDANKQLSNGASAPAPPPLPTPPAPGNEHKSAITPPGRVASPRPGQKPKKGKKMTVQKDRGAGNSLNKPSAGLLDGSVPPINVLIVEDNVINLRLLEAFMRRLKVRWKTAVNGREAVNKWKMGGFHLVLMDIQLPVMSGLEATREIRRLERVNNIGVFSSPISSNKNSRSLEDNDNASEEHVQNGQYEPQGDDVLEQRALFKSPVIVVALTASSLQSDRHEALAAGCNDFLTKPVNFVWLERKVTEWGCMQALIDFDGWRKWKEFSTEDSAATNSSTGASSTMTTTTGKTKKKPMSIRRKKETPEVRRLSDSQSQMPMLNGTGATGGGSSKDTSEAKKSAEEEDVKDDSGSGSTSTRTKGSSDPPEPQQPAKSDAS